MGHYDHHDNPNDGFSQRVNCARSSGPMTRQVPSFKCHTNNLHSGNDSRNNGGSSNNNGNKVSRLTAHHEIEIQLNSASSDTGSNSVPVEAFDSVLERRQTHLLDH